MRLLKRLLLLVPKALDLNTATSREFACRTLILASYRFPSFRLSLLTSLGSVIPSRYHLDVNLVDLIKFNYPAKSVCDKYEEHLSQVVDDDDLKQQEIFGTTEYTSSANLHPFLSESQHRLCTPVFLLQLKGSNDPRSNHHANQKPRRPSHDGCGVDSPSVHYETALGVLKRGRRRRDRKERALREAGLQKAEQSPPSRRERDRRERQSVLDLDHQFADSSELFSRRQRRRDPE